MGEDEIDIGHTVFVCVCSCVRMSNYLILFVFLFFGYTFLCCICKLQTAIRSPPQEALDLAPCVYRVPVGGEGRGRHGGRAGGVGASVERK